jgi:hypothetical protein
MEHPSSRASLVRSSWHWQEGIQNKALSIGKMIKTNFLVCVRNEGYEASLELRKLYARLPDKQAETHDMVRVTDESGEDYLYPSSLFIPVALSQKVKKALAAVAS